MRWARPLYALLGAFEEIYEKFFAATIQGDLHGFGLRRSMRPEYEGAANESQDQTNQQLLERIRQLEAKVKQLEEKESASAQEPTPQPILTSSDNTVSPRLKLNVFGDIGFQATDRRGTISNTFNIGSLDLFMTSRLSPNLSLLGEVLFISRNNNEFEADVERLVMQYHASEYLNFGIGRFHSSIGYYNTAFHQGEWFQAAIGRPFMYQFDDSGGPFAAARGRRNGQRTASLRQAGSALRG
jgi:hypothetical protein